MSTQTMIMVGIISALVIGGFVLKSIEGSKLVAVNNTTEVAPTSTEPVVPEEWLQEAEQAKQEVLKKKQLQADRDAVLQELKDAQERLDLIEQELGF